MLEYLCFKSHSLHRLAYLVYAALSNYAQGIYLEASIQTPSTNGECVTIRWVQPHNFTQYIPEGVDFRVMLTFFEFYETLLGFVLFKLYGELGIRYPLVTVATATANGGEGGSGRVVVSNPLLHPTLGGKATSVLAANLSALQVAIHQANQGNSAADAIEDALQQNNSDAAGSGSMKEKKSSKAERKKQKALMLSIDEALKGVQDADADDDNDNQSDDEDMEDEEDNVPIAAPLREALEAISDENGNNANDAVNSDTGIVITDPEAKKRHQLFNNLTFFLSREVPRGYLELIILSFGGKVGWEGQDSPIAMNDPSITHHVVDRPTLLPGYAKLPKSREYIQPQWIMDSANFNFVLPIDKYGVGKALPPHLSPWVEDKEEGYIPKYREEIEKLKNGEVLDEDMNETAAIGFGNESDKVENDEAEDDKSSSEEEEVASNDSKEDGADEEESSKESSSEDDEEEDDEDAELKSVKKKETEDEEAAHLAKALMSKKAARLYNRMQHGIAQKQAKVDNLHKKRREIENTREKNKEGKTIQKLKVERLKKERRDVEESYGEGVSGGSMKKKKRKAS
eukprot:CCRYP_015093-RC/>CCRYP_015093-RC protein AED:0.31 eAED:0.31 QI:954/1/1/1/0.5/0.33/3/446/569